MLKQVNDNNLIGRTIKELKLTKDSELIIVFQDSTFTVISSYPEEGNKSIIYNDLLDLSFIRANEAILLSMKIITEEDIGNIHRLIGERSSKC